MYTEGFIGVAGLPRSGSTLLCQLLSEHPDIHCEGHSSPVAHALSNSRRSISDDQFFLAQLDVQFDRTYAHLKSAMSAFLRHWYHDCTKPWVVDKNRAWLSLLDLLMELEPKAKLLVNIRDLSQIFGSIEAQHQKTVLVDFIDHLADYDPFGRAIQLFSKGKVVGTPLFMIKAFQSLPQEIQSRIAFVKFEYLMANPVVAMNEVFAFLGLRKFDIDPNNLSLQAHESDSHYRNKFSHRRYASITPPVPHQISSSIQKWIETEHAWFYKKFYGK